MLLLADIAADADVPIDLHLDLATRPTAMSQTFYANCCKSPNNPPALQENQRAFERLLSHNPNNPKTRFVLAHLGSDFVEQLTSQTVTALLGAHPNLFMSLRLNPAGSPQNRPVDPQNRLRPDWQGVFDNFSDRFVLGSDVFYAPASDPRFQGKTDAAKGISDFAKALPADLQRKIGSENAIRIYKLR